MRNDYEDIQKTGYLLYYISVSDIKTKQNIR